MSDEDIPRRGLLGKVLAALTPATASASGPPAPAARAEPEAREAPREKDESGGLGKGALREVRDPLAGWRR